MYPLTQATENLRKTMAVVKTVAAEVVGTNYIGSEHFIRAFFALPECEACKALTNAGVTVEAYDKLFKERVDRKYAAVGMTQNTKNMYDKAVEMAVNEGILAGTAHMLYQILRVPTSMAAQWLKELTNLEDLTQEVLSSINATVYRKKHGALSAPKSSPVVDPVSDKRTTGTLTTEKTDKKPKKAAKKDPLAEFGTDMTERAKMGKIDPVIGREKEVEKVVQVLSRRMKNNPVLVGEPGVGKSAIVEGLSRLVVEGRVPEQLYNKKIFSVDLAGMLAGTRYRGDFEEKLKNLIEAVMADGDTVLFIDEIHTIVGAGGSSEGSMDAANILKPLLARGDLQVIGATTIEEYRKYIEKDAALERRFTPVYVDEPSEADTIAIIKGIRGKYEEHHGVVITDEAIEAAVKLSARYITDRFLPDKAIDLVDETAARARIRETASEVEEAKKEVFRLAQERQQYEARNEYVLAREALATERQAQERLRALEQAQAPKTLADGRQAITREQVAAVVSARARIPLLQITQEEGEKIMRLEQDLHRRIIGQEEAVSAVSKAIRRAKAGLKDPSRPIGSFIFVGPTGVGKTDLCKALAEVLFGSEEQMIRLDMSEYMEKQSISKLIGAPPGYAGYDDLQTGQLTEKVRTKPYCVILFDEIEKAHPDVFNLLLQIFDDGRLTDSKGRTVSFKNAVIILTSNVGASSADGLGDTSYETMKENITQALLGKFRRELLNRLDEIIVFHRLSQQDCALIASKIVSGLSKRLLEERGISLTVTENALRAIVEEGYDAEYGARPLKRAVQRRIEDRLSEGILLGQIQNGQRVTVDYIGGEFRFTR